MTSKRRLKHNGLDITDIHDYSNTTIFFGGEDVVLTVSSEATNRQIEILMKMHPNATIIIDKGAD